MSEVEPRPRPYPPSESAAAARSIGGVGLSVTGIGALLILLSFTVLDWFRSTSDSQFFRDSNDSTFGELRDGFDTFKHSLVTVSPGLTRDVHFGVADQYFGWLGWVLLAAAVLLAVAAALPIGLARVMQPLGVLVGLAAAVLTVWALKLLTLSGRLASMSGGSPTFWGYVKHSGIGAWCAIGGFLLIAIGAGLGPRRPVTD